jgi:1,4-dihydroxy-2-naphthoate octaprenyltransferase
LFLFFLGRWRWGGTYYVQALELPLTVLFIGIAPGLLSMAILAVNNLRDRITDQKAGKKTLAVRFGATFVQVEYLLCLLGACAVPLVLYLQTQQHPYSLLALGILIPAIPALRQVFSKEGGTLLNPTLAQTGKLLLLYSILFSLGWLF